jgi:integrase
LVKAKTGANIMARRVRDRNLDNREARSKLPVRGKPHWRLIDRGVHLGYRRLKGKPGTWTCRVYCGHQTYTIERIGTADDFADADGVAVLSFSQAQDEARKRMVKRAHAANGVTGPLTVRAAIDLYCQALEDNGRDATGARGRAAKHVLPKLGDVEVSSLTPEVLRAWLSSIAKSKPDEADGPERMRARRASANRTWAVLRAALNHAHREGKVDADPWRRVKPLKNATAARIRYLTIAESKRLVNACSTEFRPMVEAALATGCRYGELCRLQVADFNPDAGTLHVRQSKSGKDRHVILTDEGAALFAELTAGRSGGDLILRRADGSAWGPAHQQRPMAEAVARARISPPASFHSLRHTWASLCAMAGVPLMVIAKNLGHADTQMVQRHYAHLAPSYEAEAIRAGAPVFGFKRDRKVATMRRR